MSARRRGDDIDRRGYPERDPPRASEPSRAPGRTTQGSGRSSLNDFFVDGQGIHREVLQREICKYLGPEAHSRPSIYNGVKGYTITAVRPFTPKMLDDLMELSDAYVAETRDMTRRGHPAVPYEDSRAYQQQDAILRRGQTPQDMHGQERYPPLDPYAMSAPPSGYPAVSTSSYPTQSYPAGYPQDPGLMQPFPYDAPYQTPSGRPASNNEYNRYGGDSPRFDSYGQLITYAAPVGRGEPRPDPGKRYADPRDRDPRGMEPRIPGDYSASTGNYPSSMYPPGGMDPDYGGYAAPRIPSGRPVDPYQQSRPTAADYNSRDPRSDPRYRPEPFREEPRRTGGRR